MTGVTMSAIETNRGFSVGGPGHLVARVVSLVGARLAAYRTRRELERLTDQQLNDIGLCRHDIEHVARR